jgi:uncharacterized protein (DUF1684 family)
MIYSLMQSSCTKPAFKVTNMACDSIWFSGKIRYTTLKKPGIILVLLIFSVLQLLAQSATDAAITEIEEHRSNQLKKFKSKTESPLNPEDRKTFKGLNYYPIDLKYRVKAKFVKNENPVSFKMATTTSRLPEYVKYGEVHFMIDSQEYKLEVYQSPDIIKMPGYADHLFIPFTDKTNGNDTYEVGRYLEMKIPSSGEVIIDFNKSYNPYCSYSPKYSCPIPPLVNNLPMEIQAGEKKYKDINH